MKIDGVAGMMRPRKQGINKYLTNFITLLAGNRKNYGNFKIINSFRSFAKF